MLSIAPDQEAFGVTSEQLDNTVYLHLSGELDMATTPLLEQSLRAAESVGNPDLSLDLGHVTFMDSSGLRTFLNAADRATGGGREFAITRASAVVRRVLQITGTTHLLAEDAIALARDPSVARGQDEPTPAVRMQA